MASARHPDYIRQLRERCEVFATLAEHDLTEMVSVGTIQFYELPKGDVLNLVGTAGNDVVYLLRGVIRVVRNGQPSDLAANAGTCPVVELAEHECVSVDATASALLCRTAREQLDFLIGWSTMLDNMDGVEDELQSLVGDLKYPAVFSLLPYTSVEEVFRRMRERRVTSGEVVIRQGDPADKFYIIESGRAEVWQQGSHDTPPTKVAELTDGNHFGEDALMLGGTRNATIKIVQDGNLLVLDRDDFQELINAPLRREVDAATAKAQLDHGERRMIDVRHADEWRAGHIPGAIVLPLHELRNRIGELDGEHKYITCCQSGRLSAVAAMILNENGRDAVCMHGGIRSWPFALECGD